MSLTQVYSQLVTCQEELLAAQDENRQLNTYLEQILGDIEQRAPGLKRQNDEYNRAVSMVNQLTSQIEDMKESNREDSENVELLDRKVETTLRDNDRLGKQNKDLGQQVAVLLREVEAARFGRTTRHDTSGSGEGSGEVVDADGAISDRLVSFKVCFLNRAIKTGSRKVQLINFAKKIASKLAEVENLMHNIGEQHLFDSFFFFF